MTDIKENSSWQGERISIKSVSDIVNKVPLEDIDNFMVDLKWWYICMMWAIKFNNIVPWTIQVDYNEIIRINDWKNDKNVNITINTEK